MEGGRKAGGVGEEGREGVKYCVINYASRYDQT